MLHHSRFADIDRQYLDDCILNQIGKEGAREPILICATQTAEQSLDIDADVLITTPCPGDVLLQRLGRLHRHRENTLPTAYMIHPGDLEAVLPQFATFAAKDFGRFPDGFDWGYVYSVLSVAETLRWLEANELIDIHLNSRELVERASHPGYLERSATKRDNPLWKQIWDCEYGKNTERRQRAASSVIRWEADYLNPDNAVSGDVLGPVRNASRLGVMPVTLPLSTPIQSPFGRGVIESLAIPARWLYNITLSEATVITVDRASGNESYLSVGSLRVKYSNLGLQKL